MPDLENDFKKLATDARRMAEENAKLRKINSQIISALEYVLPLLQQGLPATVDFVWTEEDVAKVQDALAEAERDRSTTIGAFAHPTHGHGLTQQRTPQSGPECVALGSSQQ